MISSLKSPGPRPRVLISNDDGIQAPGLRALVQKLAAAQICHVHVMAPSGERSAQSHAITLGRYLSCYPSEVPGADEAYAVDGTPADAVMLALNSPVFKDITFDLVASGINRGDNCGLHVIYSGTVGAAREAACKGVPAIALSLADHGARQEQHYEACAELAVPIIQSMLEAIAAGAAHHQAALTAGTVVNVNFPPLGPQSSLRPKEIDEHTPNIRVFRNYAGAVREDDSEGSDNWAVSNSWVSITPLSLRSDVPLRQGGCPVSAGAMSLVAGIIQGAAEKAKLPVFGIVEQQQQQQQPLQQQQEDLADVV